jgi:hypothetical protein
VYIQILASHRTHIEVHKICVHVSNDELEGTQAADLTLSVVPLPLYSPSKEMTAADLIAPSVETFPSLEATAPLEVVMSPSVQLLGQPAWRQQASQEQ